MKIAVLTTAVALACGSAFAQSSSTTERDASRNRSAAAATDHSSKASEEGVVAKTKRAFQRMGDKIRSAGSKSKDDADKSAASDTRTMGAAGSDSGDSARRARMDEAYANSKKARPQDK